MEWAEISALYSGRDFSLGWLKITIQNSPRGTEEKKSRMQRSSYNWKNWKAPAGAYGLLVTAEKQLH